MNKPHQAETAPLPHVQLDDRNVQDFDEEEKTRLHIGCAFLSPFFSHSVAYFRFPNKSNPVVPCQRTAQDLRYRPVACFHRCSGFLGLPTASLAGLVAAAGLIIIMEVIKSGGGSWPENLAERATGHFEYENPVACVHDSF